MTDNICPLCDIGELTSDTYTDTFSYKGNDLEVHGLQCMSCNQCASNPILTDQILKNQQIIADAKRRASGLLESSEIKKIRDTYRLTQKQAAEIFGGGANAFSKYERGDVIQSEPMDKLLRLVYSNPFILEELGYTLSFTTKKIPYYNVCSFERPHTKINPRNIPVRSVVFHNTSEEYDWAPQIRMQT